MRSYEFYEVRLGRAYDIEPVYHGPLSACAQWITRHFPDIQNDKVYLLRVQVITKYKPESSNANS